MGNDKITRTQSKSKSSKCCSSPSSASTTDLTWGLIFLIYFFTVPLHKAYLSHTYRQLCSECSVLPLMGSVNSQLRAFCRNPVTLVTGSKLHAGRCHKPGPLMEGLVPVGILGYGLGQITVLRLPDHCAMLRVAPLWWTTQLKISRFFWMHLQQPCP